MTAIPVEVEKLRAVREAAEEIIGTWHGDVAHLAQAILAALPSLPAPPSAEEALTLLGDIYNNRLGFTPQRYATLRAFIDSRKDQP